MKKLLFSENLEIIMQQQGYTQVSLSAETGISQSSISLYLKGKTSPRAGELQKIADVFGLSMDDLWRGCEISENSYVDKNKEETGDHKSNKNIHIDVNLLNGLDMVAHKNHLTEEDVIRMAITRFLDNLAKQDYDFIPAYSLHARHAAESAEQYDEGNRDCAAGC